MDKSIYTLGKTAMVIMTVIIPLSIVSTLGACVSVKVVPVLMELVNNPRLYQQTLQSQRILQPQFVTVIHGLMVFVEAGHVLQIKGTNTAAAILMGAMLKISALMMEYVLPALVPTGKMAIAEIGSALQMQGIVSEPVLLRDVTKKTNVLGIQLVQLLHLPRHPFQQ